MARRLAAGDGQEEKRWPLGRSSEEDSVLGWRCCCYNVRVGEGDPFRRRESQDIVRACRAVVSAARADPLRPARSR